jgi:hypothetical protein
VVWFEVRIGSRGADRLVHYLGKRLGPLRASDGKVKCGWNPFQTEHVDISWAAPAAVNIFRTARKEQASTLSLNPGANNITHNIVSLSTLPTNRPKINLVEINIENRITKYFILL